MTYLSLRALHLLFMGTWFGASLFTSGDVRRTLNSNPDKAALELLAERVRRISRFLGAAGWMTFLTGIALIVYLGGMAAVPWPIHASLLTVLAMLGIGMFGIGGTLQQIMAALQGGASREAVQPMVKRVVMFHGIFHGLWLLTFVLMVFRYVIAGAAGS